ncbi:MAG: hypothetical protein CM1200mP12_03660 [Gammaproteobacteria bacterium]|nr:MAG: hypothetical protein CM1200mP12_03660 [Gammaproteobacteria bacterium]
MKVSDAVSQRKSVRAFLDTPVDNKLIQALLEKSARAASGVISNLGEFLSSTMTQ